MSNINERLAKISSKLGEINIQKDCSKAHRIDSLQHKLLNLEDAFQNEQHLQSRRLTVLKDEIAKVSKQIELEVAAFDTYQATRMKEVEAFQLKATQKLEAEAFSRKEGESRLLKILEEKANFIRNDICQEQRMREELVDSINNNLDNDIPKILDFIKQEQQLREENDNSLVGKNQESLEKILQAIDSQKKLREDSEQNIFDMLKDLVQRVKAEIEMERKEREQSHEQLISLLEDAANRLVEQATN